MENIAQGHTVRKQQSGQLQFKVMHSSLGLLTMRALHILQGTGKKLTWTLFFCLRMAFRDLRASHLVSVELGHEPMIV